ncbi:MAG: 5-formyltetrahydrofolate cyclo-ligase [Desulfovibrio sp.]|jgi:5-formyltetrahydrofolate cyclo-ligase|nr:5-formyltetrahydrofolate cyclo-ligase [Desulfovibrio sp.]
MPAETAQSTTSSTNPTAGKKALRERIRILRNSQSPASSLECSQRAQERLAATEYWQSARSVALYVHCTGEMSSDMLLKTAWQSGRIVYLPRIRRTERGVMDFVPCAGPEQLRPGPFGLREPLDSLPGFDAADVGKTFAPDLLIAPGFAFDKHGSRLGCGGGFYDRFLHKNFVCPRVGLCFEFQLVESMPVEEWDQSVQYICTEKRFFDVIPDSKSTDSVNNP